MTVPTKPTKFLSETLSCKTGAAAREHIHHHLGKNMINADMGMCTSLKNGLFISQPTTSDINTFSINFVSPPSHETETDYDKNETARIMETSMNGKLTYSDVEKQTKHKNKYAKNYNELKHFTQNWADLNNLLWSNRSILAENLQQVSSHVNHHEEDYRRAFMSSDYFGAYFQQKIHTATQKFLRSCAYGDPSQLKYRALDFSTLLEAVEDDNIVVKIPTWIKPKSATTQQKKRFTGTDNNKAGKRTRKPDKRVDNPDKDTKCLLRPDEDFKMIFNPIAKHGMDPPKQNDGKEMCNKFHGRGWCLQDCQRGHATNKTQEEKKKWISFLTHCRKNSLAKKDEIKQMQSKNFKPNKKG